MNFKNVTCITIVTLLMNSTTVYSNTLEKKGVPPSKAVSLKEISELALENSLDIQIAKYDAYIKRTSLGKAKSIFDTFLGANIDYLHDEKERQLSLLGTKNIINNYEASLNKKLPTGTDVRLDVKHKRDDSDSQFDVINPGHDASIGISIKQPIGKNFFGLADRASIKITKIDIANSDFTSLDKIEDALGQAQKAYWYYILKSEELDIKHDMRNESQRLFEVYENKYRIGSAEKADVIASAANVRQRDSEVIASQLAKETAKINLLFLLNISDLTLQLKPEESLAVVTHGVDLATAANTAIDKRRDYKAVKNMLKMNRIDLTVKKNALWPEIDLQASFLRNGLDTDYKQAWDDVFDQNHEEYYFGVAVNYPFENNKARAEKKEAEITKQKLILTLKKVERMILKDVNNDVNGVNMIRNQTDLYSILVNLETDKLAEEKKRQSYGRSSSDILIRFENDLLTARLSLASTLYLYRISLIDLDVTQNILLDRYWEDKL